MNFFAMLKYGAVATEPPYTPDQFPDPMEEPWTQRSAGVKRAVEADVTRKKRYWAKKRHPTVAHSAPSQLRAKAAGEITGAWDRLGGIGAQLTNVAEVTEIAVGANQEAAAKFAEEQDREWQQSARGFHGVKQIEPQLRHPDHLPVIRVTEYQKGEFMERVEKGGKDNPSYESEGQPKELSCRMLTQYTVSPARLRSLSVD